MAVGGLVQAHAGGVDLRCQCLLRRGVVTTPCDVELQRGSHGRGPGPGPRARRDLGQTCDLPPRHAEQRAKVNKPLSELPIAIPLMHWPRLVISLDPSTIPGAQTRLAWHLRPPRILVSALQSHSHSGILPRHSVPAAALVDCEGYPSMSHSRVEYIRQYRAGHQRPFA